MADREMNGVAIIIPVVNGRANLELLLPRLDTYEVYVVDEGSTDGTQQLCTGWKNVHLIEKRKASGVVSSILEGFENLPKDNRYAIVMDSDLSHDPKYIHDMLDKAEEASADLVIGSRYTSGGKNRDSMFRRLSSFAGNIAFRSTFSAKVKDATSAYRVYSSRAIRYLLDSAVTEPISPSHAGQIDILRRILSNRDFIVREVPIEFRKAEARSSSLRLKDIRDFVSLVLRKGNIVRYAIVGASGVLVNELILALLYGYMGLPADPLAIEASVVSNFVLNDRFTFRKKGAINSAFLFRLARYNIFSLLGIGVNAGVFYALVRFQHLQSSNLFGIVLAEFIGIMSAFIVTYISSTFFVWGERGK